MGSTDPGTGLQLGPTEGSASSSLHQNAEVMAVPGDTWPAPVPTRQPQDRINQPMQAMSTCSKASGVSQWIAPQPPKVPAPWVLSAKSGSVKAAPVSTPRPSSTVTVWTQNPTPQPHHKNESITKSMQMSMRGMMGESTPAVSKRQGGVRSSGEDRRLDGGQTIPPQYEKWEKVVDLTRSEGSSEHRAGEQHRYTQKYEPFVCTASRPPGKRRKKALPKEPACMGQGYELEDRRYAATLARTGPQRLRGYLGVDIQMMAKKRAVTSTMENRLVYTRYRMKVTELTRLFGVPHLKDVIDFALKTGEVQSAKAALGKGGEARRSPQKGANVEVRKVDQQVGQEIENSPISEGGEGGADQRAYSDAEAVCTTEPGAVADKELNKTAGCPAGKAELIGGEVSAGSGDGYVRRGCSPRRSNNESKKNGKSVSFAEHPERGGAFGQAPGPRQDGLVQNIDVPQQEKSDKGKTGEQKKAGQKKAPAPQRAVPLQVRERVDCDCYCCFGWSAYNIKQNRCSGAKGGSDWPTSAAAGYKRSGVREPDKVWGSESGSPGQRDKPEATQAPYLA